METNSHPSLYRSLGGPRNTRLIEIQPDDLNDDISCSLFTANIDDNRPYFSLSYVWGDPTKTQPVKVTALPFTQPKISLWKLRSGYQGKVFWIDTICISQKDLQERAQQVQLMCDVFKFAENVVIYLGEQSDGLSRAMKLFHVLYDNPEKIRRELCRLLPC